MQATLEQPTTTDTAPITPIWQMTAEEYAALTWEEKGAEDAAYRAEVGDGGTGASPFHCNYYGCRMWEAVGRGYAIPKHIREAMSAKPDGIRISAAGVLKSYFAPYNRHSDLSPGSYAMKIHPDVFTWLMGGIDADYVHEFMSEEAHLYPVELGHLYNEGLMSWVDAWEAAKIVGAKERGEDPYVANEAHRREVWDKYHVRHEGAVYPPPTHYLTLANDFVEGRVSRRDVPVRTNR